jgi:hypothetical protein
MYDFEADEEALIISDKLENVSPEEFAKTFTYGEKVKLLLYLVNTTHDLLGF